MKVKQRHIIHFVVHNSTNLKSALLVLYNNNKLFGSIGHAGIVLVNKIKNKNHFNESEYLQARQVLSYYSSVLAELVNDGRFKL